MGELVPFYINCYTKAPTYHLGQFSKALEETLQP
jgi:hypothetical protein